MDKQLDTYFKKAKESLSEPPPISEVIRMLDASPGPQSTNWWLRKQFQVLIAVAVVLIGLFLIQFFNNDAKITVTDKETTDQEITSSQENESSDVVIEDAESKESTDQEDTPEVSDNEVADDPKVDDSPAQDDNKTADIPDDEPANTAVTTADESKTQDDEKDAVVDNSTNPDLSGTVDVAKTPPDNTTDETPEDTPDETAADNIVTHEKYEIIFKSTDAEIDKLTRKLKKDFGIELTIDGKKRDRGFIIKLNGTVDDLNSKYKMPFKINNPSFDKFTISFDYSKADRAQNIKVLAD